MCCVCFKYDTKSDFRKAYFKLQRNKNDTCDDELTITLCKLPANALHNERQYALVLSLSRPPSTVFGLHEGASHFVHGSNS